MLAKHVVHLISDVLFPGQTTRLDAAEHHLVGTSGQCIVNIQELLVSIPELLVSMQEAQLVSMQETRVNMQELPVNL